MKRSRFTEEQIIGIRKEAAAGKKVPDLCREHGIAAWTFYRVAEEVYGHDGVGGQETAISGGGKPEAQSDRGASDAGEYGVEGAAHKKMVRPAERRPAADYLLETSRISERRACRVTGLHRSTLHYEPQPDRKEGIRMRLQELAEQSPRWGQPRLHVLLRREGMMVNHKRTARLYGARGLS